MRTIMFMAAAAAALTAFAAPADAERVCRQVCAAGFCQTQCFDSGDHIYLDKRDRDFFDQHGRPAAFMDRD
jgi:hypothetical protein